MRRSAVESGRKKRLRIAVVGCGFYAQNHLNAWRDLADDGADLVGVCDIDAARARQASAEFSTAAYLDIATMLSEAQPDIVDIVTRYDTHRPLVELVASRGIGVIVQKPMAPNWEDCVAIAKAAERSGIFFCVHEDFRFQSAIRRVRQLLARFVIGKPTFARISYRTGYDVFRMQPYLKDEPKLVILDVGVHVLDLARYLIGEVRHLSCETQRKYRFVAGEDTAAMLLRHTDGVVSVVDCSFAAQRLEECFPRTQIEIEGDEGVLSLTAEKLTVKSREILWSEDIRTPLLPWSEHPWHVLQESVLNFNRHVLDAYLAGDSAETNLSDSLRTYALVEAAYRSAAQGVTVAVGSVHIAN